MLAVLVAGIGIGSTTTAAAQVVQEGDNKADVDQDGDSQTGDAVAGQVVGIVSSGDVSVDARNRVEDAKAKSGDAESSNRVTAFTGNRVEFGEECPNEIIAQETCPEAAGDVGAAIVADDIIAVIVHDGDNEQKIKQSASAETGAAIAGGQVVGVVGAGVVGIVLDNMAEDVEATSGDADAHNEIGNAEAANVVEFIGCTECPPPDITAQSIVADFISAAIVHDGDNEQSIGQTANASSGDAVSGSQVVGAVGAAGGQISIDATNRAEDTEATSGDAEATNTIENAQSGNFVLDIPEGECCPIPTEPQAGVESITADEIESIIVHDGDNEQEIDQAADASSGDAVSGSQIVGAVGAGVIDIVLDNAAEDTEATSGDADAHNFIGSAETSNLVTFLICFECVEPIPILTINSIDAGTINSVIVHSGDNDQEIDQTADASTGDAVSGSQVAGAVSAAGGQISIDATNRAEDTEATSGDADASNTIGLAASGNAVLDIPEGACCPIPLEPVFVLSSITAGEINAVIVHDGDNDQEIDQAADASSGDAVSGSQVVGAVGGGAISIVLDNFARDVDATSGDADASNEIEGAEASNVVRFPEDCPDCPIPEEPINGFDVDAIDVDFLAALIVHDGDNDQEIDQTADASSGDAVGGAQIVGAVASAGGSVSIDATNRAEDVDVTTGDADADNFIGLASAGNAVLNGFLEEVGEPLIAHVGDNSQDIEQTADASTGDAVGGGQVIGAIGGNVDAVLESSARNIDLESGRSRVSNTAASEVGNLVIFVTEPFDEVGSSVPVSDALTLGLALLAGLQLTLRGRRPAGR